MVPSLAACSSTRRRWNNSASRTPTPTLRWPVSKHSRQTSTLIPCRWTPGGLTGGSRPTDRSGHQLLPGTIPSVSHAPIRPACLTPTFSPSTRATWPSGRPCGHFATHQRTRSRTKPPERQPHGAPEPAVSAPGQPGHQFSQTPAPPDSRGGTFQARPGGDDVPAPNHELRKLPTTGQGIYPGYEGSLR